MNSFAFHNPALVRRTGIFLIAGTSVLLVVIAIVLAGIARGNYERITEQQVTIAQAARAAKSVESSRDPVTFYSADTPQLAQSRMQSDMQELALQNQVELEVIRAEQIEELGGSLRLALTLNGVVQESQLGGYIESLASHKPTIVVQSISLRRARSTDRSADNRPLAVQLKLSGFASR